MKEGFAMYRDTQAASLIVKVSIKVSQVLIQRADVLVDMVINLMRQIHLLICYSEYLQCKDRA